MAGLVAKLIPRLGSPFDGEVVATARAIERTLKADGQDWHDIARAVCAKPVAPLSAPLWANLSFSQQLLWIDELGCRILLTQWEAAFVEDMKSYARRRPLSPKQQAIMNRLIARAYAMGARV